jgi:gliding motility-associated-like protein
MITVTFDSVYQNNYITLRASDDSGFCYTDAQIRIKVIPQPTMIAYTKHDVCLGDTVELSLASRSDDAYTYKWFVDNVIMSASNALSIVTSNSNTGGPYSISWVDSGRHVIKITSSSAEGCKSLPTYDTVLVHTGPDAAFAISSQHPHGICLEDSVEFTARINNLNYSYVWGPEHDFNNLNQSIAWGKMEEVNNVITLKVTDPYGCYATATLNVDAGSCCLIAFPNAFTPNGSGPEENNVFKPYVAGYHRFHLFRIMNRWGQTIFESANSSVMGWDGKFNGVPQDMGVYYYVLKYDCGGKTLEQKGDVTLIR